MKILDDTKVVATPEAIKLIEKLKEKYGPDLLFHQSGGCCDGSAPMCYLQSEYIVGDNDVKLGEIGGIPFYMNDDQFEKWKLSHETFKTFHYKYKYLVNLPFYEL